MVLGQAVVVVELGQDPLHLLGLVGLKLAVAVAAGAVDHLERLLELLLVDLLPRLLAELVLLARDPLESSSPLLALARRSSWSSESFTEASSR